MVFVRDIFSSMLIIEIYSVLDKRAFNLFTSNKLNEILGIIKPFTVLVEKKKIIISELFSGFLKSLRES